MFEIHHRYQCARELLFSTAVKTLTLLVLDLRPSLHAAACRIDKLLVSLAALDHKVDRTEPDVLRTLVRVSAARLAPAMACLNRTASLSG